MELALGRLSVDCDTLEWISYSSGRHSGNEPTCERNSELPFRELILAIELLDRSQKGLVDGELQADEGGIGGQEGESSLVEAADAEPTHLLHEGVRQVLIFVNVVLGLQAALYQIVREVHGEGKRLGHDGRDDEHDRRVDVHAVHLVERQFYELVQEEIHESLENSPVEARREPSSETENPFLFPNVLQLLAC